MDFKVRRQSPHPLPDPPKNTPRTPSERRNDPHMPQAILSTIPATIPDTIKFSAAELYQKLKDRHVLVRYFNAQRLDNKLRVSIGTGEENDQLLSTLVDILKQS